MLRPLPKPSLIPPATKRLLEATGDRSMSYIAGFHCRDGIVMCADTLETYGDYKNYVEKLAVIEDRSYPLAIGGAGIEDLIDPFTQEVLERTKATQPPT